jgi:tripartite-type tricarboxylate transporter receptor subunit TctC
MHQPLMPRRALLRTALWALAAGAAPLARGQAYPAKPIRLVVPFTPGGSTDILARAIGQKLGETFGGEAVAKSPPDGYTLLMGHIGTLAVNPSLYPRLGYDPVKSFAPVAWVARVPNVLVVGNAVPARSVKELVALARARPGSLNYGSGGNGSAAHIATEYFKLQSGTFLVHIPYRGTAPAVTDLIAGQLSLMFTGAPAVMPQVKAGQLRALAVSSQKRMEAFPDLPTVAEGGYPGFEADQWYGVVAPAGTPAEVVGRLNAAINRALTTPELRQRLAGEGAEAVAATPQAFGAHIAREIERWRPVIKAGNVKAD